MNNQDEQLELEQVEAEYWVDQYNALLRLEKNVDFKTVILDGYLKERALDQVSLLANDQVKRAGHRPEIMELLVAISTLQDHFGVIKNLGSIAQYDMDEAEGPTAE